MGNPAFRYAGKCASSTIEPAPMVTIGFGWDGASQDWRREAGSKLMQRGSGSVVVKDFLRRRPPIPFLAASEWCLHRFMNRPPLLRLRVRLHLGCVRRPILSMIL